MGRQLDTATLDVAARHYAAEFIRPDMPHPHVKGRFIAGHEYVLVNMFGFTFKDEFDYLASKIRGYLGPDSLKDFDKEAAARFEPRSDKLFADLLADKLAIDVNGEHIRGKIGTTKVGSRVIGKGLTVRGNLKNLYWNIYAGEIEERLAESGVATALPPGTEGLPVGALNTRISNESALLGANALVDNLDEGTAGAVIQGRTGAQPADPDTAVTGTNLFTLTCSDPAFGAATDAAPGALKTANAITDDSSADATGTLGYCRASSSSVANTPLDDHIDGEAGTSGADFNFNTLAIVAGAVVSMTSWTITLPES